MKTMKVLIVCDCSWRDPATGELRTAAARSVAEMPEYFALRALVAKCAKRCGFIDKIDRRKWNIPSTSPCPYHLGDTITRPKPIDPAAGPGGTRYPDFALEPPPGEPHFVYSNHDPDGFVPEPIRHSGYEQAQAERAASANFLGDMRGWLTGEWARRKRPWFY